MEWGQNYQVSWYWTGPQRTIFIAILMAVSVHHLTTAPRHGHGGLDTWHLTTAPHQGGLDTLKFDLHQHNDICRRSSFRLLAVWLVFFNQYLLAFAAVLQLVLTDICNRVYTVLFYHTRTSSRYAALLLGPCRAGTRGPHFAPSCGLHLAALSSLVIWEKKLTQEVWALYDHPKWLRP